MTVKKHLSDNYNRTATWESGVTCNFNDYGEVEGMTEIICRYPSETFCKRNDEQRQEFADKNSNGELGRAYRYRSDASGREWYVDFNARVFWLEDYR
tara:strand:+ start:208 stop:498 length:291 start_codon:yes stop_codon:yes gene_type:complete